MNKEQMLNEIRKEVSNKKQLDEGIVFFKDSKKIEGMLSRTNEVIAKVTDATLRSQLKSVYSEANKIRNNFKKLEQKYSQEQDKEKKEVLKKEHQQIKVDSKELLQKIKEVDMTNIFMEMDKVKGAQLMLVVGVLYSLGALAFAYYLGETNILFASGATIATSFSLGSIAKYKELSQKLGMNFPNVNKALKKAEDVLS